MSDLIESGWKYLRALETGDPDRQLCNPDDDVIIVRGLIDEIERLTAEVKMGWDEGNNQADYARKLEAELERLKVDQAAYEEELEKQRKQLVKWRRFGRNVIDQVHDWSNGHISRSVFISRETEVAIQEMLDD